MPAPFRPQVLVVEDTRTGRQALTAAFAADYRLRLAASGAQAVAQLRRHPIAVIGLADVLQRQDGLALVPRLRRARATAPILLYAKPGSEALALRALRARVDGYVKQAASPAQLREAVRRLLPPGRSPAALAAHLRACLDHQSVTGDSLSAYAQQVGLSEQQLRRDFRAAYGLTPRRYGVWVRLRQAAQLLRATRLRVGQIARQTGYASPTALGRAFRHGYGTTPRAYRAAPVPDPPPPGDPGPGLGGPTAEG